MSFATKWHKICYGIKTYDTTKFSLVYIMCNKLIDTNYWLKLKFKNFFPKTPIFLIHFFYQKQYTVQLIDEKIIEWFFSQFIVVWFDWCKNRMKVHETWVWIHHEMHVLNLIYTG